MGKKFGKIGGRARNLMISGKSGKIGESKELKRWGLNVSKIRNFRQKGPGMGVGRGFIGVYRGF